MSQPGTEHTHSGPGHDLLAHLFFGGRRRRVYTRMAELSGARPGDRVLDVGCGDGYLARLLAGVGPTGAVHGVDPSAETIDRAQRSSRDPRCTFAQGSALALDAPDASYDVVVSALVLHHIDEADRLTALREMRRVLRPGGTLLIGEFRPPTNSLLHRVIRRLVSPAMLDNQLAELALLVTRAGFSDLAIGDLHPWIRYLRANGPTR